MMDKGEKCLLELNVEEIMRLLLLGNSFTYENNMPGILAEMLKAEVVQHTMGGALLSDQLNEDTELGKETIFAFEKETWDYVILQEMSSLPVTSKDTFMNSVENLCDEIRDAGAIPVLFATWAYREGNEKYEELGISYQEMASLLHDAYQEAAEQNHALIAEVGQKFYELSGERELYAEDGIHPNEEGSRLAAEVIATVIQKDWSARRPTANIVMPALKKNDLRLRILYLLKILQQHTDAEHTLTTNQIRSLMEQEYGFTMHRTTVAGDIEALRQAGFEIIGHRYRQNRYYLESRPFEMAELKILIDAVESSRFITERKSQRLVKKLMSLTNEENAKKLKRNVYTSGRVRSGNEKGYYIVDAINTAINEGKRISFYYTDYDGKKNQILRNDGNAYIITPFLLVWNGDFYYLVGYDHVKENTRTYRVDRILRQPEILKENAAPLPEGFDAARYTKEVFRMFEKQEPQEVTLIYTGDVVKGIIDQFGMGINTWQIDDEHFRTKVKVCTSPTFYGWVFQWGGKVRIEGPAAVLREYQEMVLKAIQ